MRTLDCQYKTAWCMMHRIREAMRPAGATLPGGGGKTVAADETYIGRKSASRADEPPGVERAVLALVERGGAVRSFHVANVTANNLQPMHRSVGGSGAAQVANQIGTGPCSAPRFLISPIPDSLFWTQNRCDDRP